jgi:hypothetical protein
VPSSTPGANGSQLIRLPPRRAEYAFAEIWDGIAAAECAGVPHDALVGALRDPRALQFFGILPSRPRKWR